jgi:phospholipid/cholesterol/gamma-HCH transport system permease protein
MPLAFVEKVGRRTGDILAAFGDFFTFVGKALAWIFFSGLRWKNIKLLFPQMYEIGVRSVPVVAATGGFIGMVMALDAANEFKALGQENRIGSFINLSVVKEIGPVLAAVMLAGRVGCALTAELGTMNVTEQLDALRVMGSDPIRYLVVPRFLVCLLLTPILTIYSDVLGIFGGWAIAVSTLGVPNSPYWAFSDVETWQIVEGVTKSFFFGGAIGLIACYKGFNSGSGARGVGRACTDSFVASFIAILIINYVFSKMLRDMYLALYGVRGIF